MSESKKSQTIEKFSNLKLLKGGYKNKYKMKKLFSLLAMAMLVVSVMPMILGVSVGTGVTPDIITEDFEPIVWMCDNRIVLDDATEPGRVSPDGTELIERINNYAFEGEQIQWNVLVMDKNGKEKIEDVFATVGDIQGIGNEIEVNCQETSPYFVRDVDEICDEKGCAPRIPDSCNARILEEKLHKFNKDTMQYYECTLTVETADSMWGEYWVTVEAMDYDGYSGTMDENEYWYFNPFVALSIDGDMWFEDVRPGTSSYSDTMLVGNDADQGSGVMLDMFISGTDFYDSASSGAMCPTTNQLALSNFRYFATNGAYSTSKDLEEDAVNGNRNCDAEGYCNIEYGIGFNDPNPFYENAEILQAQKQGPYYVANTLAPGAEMSITFRLDLPEPCNGDFDTGSIYFWGEAI